MHSSRTRLSVLTLATGLFVVTTSEFQVAAMTIDMAAELGVSPATIGLLVTTYSLGMGLGGPLIAWLLRRAPAKTALVAVLGAYAAAEAAAGMVSDMPALFALRCVTGALSGATFGMSMSIGIGLAPAKLQNRASATILTGLMLGTLVGLPLSHLLAALFGWRTSFLVLAAGAAFMALGTYLLIPSETATDSPAATPEDSPLRARLWLRFAGSFFTIGGAFAAFTYIDLLLRRGGLGEFGATWAMLGFGIAALAMNTLAGRVAPGRARGWLITGHVVQLAALGVFLTSSQNAPLAILATLLLGGTGIALNPLLVNRVLAVAPPTVLVNTLHTSAITLGLAAATATGSRVFHSTEDVSSAIWVGIGSTVVAFALTAVSPDRRARHEVHPVPCPANR